MRSVGKAHTLRGLVALALVAGVGVGCFAIGVEFEQTPPKTCTKDADCGDSNECGTRACNDGFCEIKPVPRGTAAKDQAAGDCKVQVCDGKGNIITQTSDADAVDDGNPCTMDKCVDGLPDYAPAAPGTKCGAKNDLDCNATGECVGCMNGSECGAETLCVTWTCDVGICNQLIKAAGTFAEDPVLADCKANFCGIGGQIESKPYDDKQDDGNECTDDGCDEGTPTHTPKLDGSKCGMGCQSCTGGMCGDCSPGYVCNAGVNACIPTQSLDNGSACSFDTDCASGKCVDGVCCNSVCDSLCMACTNAKTGQPDGTCSPIATGTDPDDECQNPAGDVCNNGKCQCYNGMKESVELKVDCGGICTPCPGMWVCDGNPPCESSLNAVCCFQLCALCDTTLGNDCKALHGKPCQLEVDQPKKYNLKLGITPECSGQSSQACISSTCYCK